MHKIDPQLHSPISKKGIIINLRKGAVRKLSRLFGIFLRKNKGDKNTQQIVNKRINYESNFTNLDFELSK